MKIKQWEDKNLAHYSYGIMSDCEKKIVLIDPARNAQQYIDWAEENGAVITGVIETHPHADFVSGHLEIHQRTGATIYVHSKVGVSYPHADFDEGAEIQFGNIKLTSLYTPGHSPDSISILLEHQGKQHAVFTGDTLFIGDCGRPDLREGAGNIQLKREDLARMMFHSLRDKLMTLEDDVIVYPAHGAGTLCGKNLSKDNSSTIGREKKSNWSLQPSSEDDFVKELLTDQPFIPHYFGYDVEINRKGAPHLEDSIQKVKINDEQVNSAPGEPDKDTWVVDARDEGSFKKGHFPNSINLMEKGKFETWLGSIIKPGEQFYLAAENKAQVDRLLQRIAAIGYEPQVKEAFVITSGPVEQPRLDVDRFRNNQEEYTIIDVRNTTEVNHGKIFNNAIAIPLAEIRERAGEIPQEKPIVVHCAGGYRSAAASSVIKSILNGTTTVYDLGEEIKKF